MDPNSPLFANLMNNGQPKEGEETFDPADRKRKAIEHLIKTNPLFKDYTVESFQAKMDAHVYRLKCSTCGTAETDELKLKRCTRCKDSYYCNSDCQAKDWAEHKKICYKQDKD